LTVLILKKATNYCMDGSAIAIAIAIAVCRVGSGSVLGTPQTGMRMIETGKGCMHANSG
jgi:hypothetical protein